MSLSILTFLFCYLQKLAVKFESFLIAPQYWLFRRRTENMTGSNLRDGNDKRNIIRETCVTSYSNSTGVNKYNGISRRK